jgi:hypothetical protein
MGVSRPKYHAMQFWEQVDRSGECWLWLGAKAINGYGRFGARPSWAAHRWAYTFTRGPIPDGLTLDHLCRNLLCVRPDHLEAVTDRVNILRGTGPAAANATKTHCKRGHPLSGPNLYIRQSTGRYKHNGQTERVCRACKRIRHGGKNSAEPLTLPARPHGGPEDQAGAAAPACRCGHDAWDHTWRCNAQLAPDEWCDCIEWREA